MFGFSRLAPTSVRRAWYRLVARRTRIRLERNVQRDGFIPLDVLKSIHLPKVPHSAGKRIHIVTEDAVEFILAGYLLKALARRWGQQGHVVTVGETNHFPPADIACLHMDTTDLKDAFAHIAGNYPRVLNGRFLDNSKRRLSKRLLTADSNYSGPVILKTDANYGGLPELRHRYPGGIPEALIARSFIDPDIDWHRVEHIPSKNYFVLDSKDTVPAPVWSNPHLVVEQFTPEIDQNGLFCMRACLFFGRREACILMRSRSQIIKGPNVIEREFLNGPAPQEVQAFKREHGIDFGRIDYVIHRGEVIILDANKTASLSHEAASMLAHVITQPLAEGLRDYV